MKCPEELRQKLWELIFDLLPPEEAEPLRAQIVSDPAVARAYSEARLRADVVATAARQEESRLPLRLPDEEGVFRTEASGEWSKSSVLTTSATSMTSTSSVIRTRLLPMAVRWFSGLAALALLAFTVGYMAFGEPWAAVAAREAREELAQDFVGIVIAGPPTAEPGVTQNYSISTRSLDGSAVSTSVIYGLQSSRGEETWRKEARTSDNGVLQVELPANLVDRQTSLWVVPETEATEPLRANLFAESATTDFARDAASTTKWYLASRVIEARDQLELNVHAARTDNLLVTAESNGRQVAQQTLAPPANESSAKPDAVLSLPLDGRAAGATRLKAYDYGQSPPEPLGDELFWVQPATRLNIYRTDSTESYAPGQEVQLQLRVQASDGKPVPASLRVAVVEKSELSSRNRDTVNFKLADESSPLDKDLAEKSEEFLVVSDMDVNGTAPLVVDNSIQVRKAHLRALAEFDAKRQSQVRQVGWIITAGSALLLGGLGLAAVGRFMGDVRWFALKVAACIFCVLVGVAYGFARVDAEGNTAFSPFSLPDGPVAGKKEAQLAAAPPASRVRASNHENVGARDEQAGKLPSNVDQTAAGVPSGDVRPGESTVDGGERKGGEGISSTTAGSGKAGVGVIAPATQPEPGEPVTGTPEPGKVASGLAFDSPVSQAGALSTRKRNDLEVKPLYSNLELSANQNGEAPVAFTLPPKPGDYWVFVEARVDNRVGLYRCKISSRAPAAAAPAKE